MSGRLKLKLNVNMMCHEHFKDVAAELITEATWVILVWPDSLLFVYRLGLMQIMESRHGLERGAVAKFQI